ncbi:hypothetical protein D9758_002660 [Tetrapyrgos nigripes]|uniref:Metallo-dependent hydrolase n=1 Tax=Tetrapyrgos nigripes TaxID=182062 RepID=A0A8H5GQT5_9AGAR|nr:hypothetical protein D9758_002660 [Tetrapyrgos nigripes]
MPSTTIKKWCDKVFWKSLSSPFFDDYPYTALLIKNVRLPDSDPEATWNVVCDNGVVSAVEQLESSVLASSPRGCNEIDARGGIMIPSLCHSHIHLDKCFILDRCGDLQMGDFAEAMHLTGIAKAAFPTEKASLLERGRKLIRNSLACGVTAIRAHVEVDELAKFSALDVAVQLQQEFKDTCHVQIAVFAQEALFRNPTDAEPGPNWNFIIRALEREPSIEVVGSAPYVEPSIEQAKKNIAMILELASRFSLHADFHLDYNLNPNSEPLVYEVISQAQKLPEYWLLVPETQALGPDREESDIPKLNLDPDPIHRRITIGHATRLQLFTPSQWKDLVQAIGDLPITFVGLPHSDMYMQGRDSADTPLGAPRSTLRVPQLAKNYGLEVAMSVNNVQNAFTPQGSVDPLSLCSFGVAVFQAATKEDVEILMKSVTLTSKLAMGYPPSQLPRALHPRLGDPADFVILHGTQTLRDAVFNPSYDRTTIKRGIVVSRRTSHTSFRYHDVIKEDQPNHWMSIWYHRLTLPWWWYAFLPVTWPYVVYRLLVLGRPETRQKAGWVVEEEEE